MDRPAIGRMGTRFHRGTAVRDNVIAARSMRFQIRHAARHDMPDQRIPAE